MEKSLFQLLLVGNNELPLYQLMWNVLVMIKKRTGINTHHFWNIQFFIYFKGRAD